MSLSKAKDQQSEQEDYSEDQSCDEESKLIIKKPKVQKLDNMKNLKKIIINVSMTQYPVIIEVAEELGWKIQYSLDAGDWDVFWTDWHIEPEVLIKMHLFQKISHLPGIHHLARKNLLGLNLMSMRQYFPEQYNFFPLTWMLPQQYVQFRTYFESKPKGKARTYIVKPEADCQGRGIFLTRKIQTIQNGKHYVVQRYMSRPFLIDNLKFDMRIYVLIGSLNPLRIYLYEDGLARFATQPYIEPNVSNLDKQYMHLTNYAINKKNPKFVFNNNASNMGFGHKRSLICVMKQIQAKGVNVIELKNKIKDLIIKTIITGLPIMSHQYKCSQPQDYTGNMCFHILGFDVMLKSTLEPILLEVNHTPSFTTDTPLDFKIKKGLIKDTLKIMNININKKIELYSLCMENTQVRLLTGKRNILEGKQRDQLIAKYQKEREEYEKNNLGGFEVIYPSQSQEKMNIYQNIIDHCNKQYFEEKASVRMKIAERQAKKIARQDYKELKKNKIQADQPQIEKQNQKLIQNQKINQNKKQKHKKTQNEKEQKAYSNDCQKREKQNLSEKNSQQAFNQKVKLDFQNYHEITEQNKKKVKFPQTQSKQASPTLPACKTPIKLFKKKTIDNSQILTKHGSTSRQKRNQINAFNVRTSQKIKAQSQKNVPLQFSHFKVSKIAPKLHERRNPTPIFKLQDQKTSQLPLLADNSPQVSQKPNLIMGLQYDHLRYIKGSSHIQKQLMQRSISGKGNSMAKSTSTVQKQKEDLANRQNLSSLMVRKIFEQKINQKYRAIDSKNVLQLKKERNKISYNSGIHFSCNPTVEQSINGEFLMPKIYCLNFEGEKSEQSMTFLQFKNQQNASK